MGTGYLGQGGDLQQDAASLLLKDYKHASNIFLNNGYQLIPRMKFLFHVRFNINTAEIKQLRDKYGSPTVATLGMMVKSIDLPKYKIETDVMNQYNRKRVIQKKIRYEPCRFSLHDDQSNLIRGMWYDYYTYYYKDAIQKYDGVPNQSGTLGETAGVSNGYNYNVSDIYSNALQSADWGYVGESYTDGTNPSTSSNGKPRFFRDITIYGMSQKTYASWVLINPLITSWGEDTYNYEEGGGTMKDDVTVEYETVKYYKGAIGGEQPSTTVSGFAIPGYYDTQPSGITRQGATNSVFGQTGILPAVQGTVQDLQAPNSGSNGLQNTIGAVQRASVASGTGAQQDLSESEQPQLQQEATAAALNSAPNSARGAVNANSGMAFPRATSTGFNSANNPGTVGNALANGTLTGEQARAAAERVNAQRAAFNIDDY